MTYMDYLNRFWQIDIEVNFSGTESKLYFALLDIANKLHWGKTELSIPNNRLLAVTGCTKNTLVSARNRLVQYGLVKYVKGNRNKYSGKYILLDTDVGSIIDLTSDLTTDLTTDPTTDPNTDPYIRKDKIKKRKEKDNTYTSYTGTDIINNNSKSKNNKNSLNIPKDNLLLESSLKKPSKDSKLKDNSKNLSDNKNVNSNTAERKSAYDVFRSIYGTDLGNKYIARLKKGLREFEFLEYLLNEKNFKLSEDFENPVGYIITISKSQWPYYEQWKSRKFKEGDLVDGN